MSQWFRAYTEIIDDPKVQRLPDALFKTWVNVLCLAARRDGALPGMAELAFSLRLPEKEAIKRVNALVAAGLLDAAEDGIRPHNWHGRQYKTDSSAERVRQLRARQKERSSNVTRNVTETVDATGPESDSESDTESDTESDSEIQKESSSARWHDKKWLSDKLTAAANGHLAPKCTDLRPIEALLWDGFDLENDILPVVKALVPMLAKPLATWHARWLRDAIVEAARVKRAARMPQAIQPMRFVEKGSAEWTAKCAELKERKQPGLPECHDATGMIGWFFPDQALDSVVRAEG